MEVVFLHGPPASGKLTIGRRVARATGYRLFHNHLTVDLALALFEFGSQPFVRLREGIWLQAFTEAAAAGRSLVFTFHPEATVAPELVTRIESIVTAAGGRVAYVELVCPDAEVERRIASPDRTRFGKLADPALFRELRDAGAFAFPALPEPILRVDTSRTSSEEAAARIVARLEGRAVGPVGETSGSVVGVHVASGAREPARALPEATLIPGRGVVGDRYHDGTGTFSGKLRGRPDSEVTLVEMEEIERFNRRERLDLGAGDLRRNLVTRGVRLNDLVGVRFRVGEVELVGWRLCEPCRHLAEVVHPRVLPALAGRAGLRASIATGGIVRPGDPISR